MLEKSIKDKGGIHELRWKKYKKYKEVLIKDEFLVEFPHQKGGKIVWNFLNGHIIEEK